MADNVSPIFLAAAFQADAAGGLDFGLAIVAAGLAFAAAIALPIGALFGIWLRPAQKWTATIMAFGAGALIEALALELAFHGAESLIVHHRMDAITAWLYVAFGFLLGGGLFLLGNRMLEDHGGHLRKPSLVRAYIARNRSHLQDVLHRLHIDHLPRLHINGIHHLRQAEHVAVAQEGQRKHGGAPFAIFLGALLDGVPESIVIGASVTAVSLATYNPSFVVAVFLNNFPEAMSSAVGMVRGGFSPVRVMVLWGGLMAGCTVVGALGYLLMSGASPEAATFVNAVAGGGILAMLAATMMPEAFEEGGPMVGIATILGFLSAFLFTANGLA